MHSIKDESTRGKEDEENEEISVIEEDDYQLVDSSSNRRRADKRKREKEDSLEDIHLMTVATDTMGKLKLKVVELVKEMVP